MPGSHDDVLGGKEDGGGEKEGGLTNTLEGQNKTQS